LYKGKWVSNQGPQQDKSYGIPIRFTQRLVQAQCIRAMYVYLYPVWDKEPEAILGK